MTVVTMTNSVGPWVAGESYDDMDEELADQFIIKGYAEGELSRPYSDQEREQLLAQIQQVSV